MKESGSSPLIPPGYKQTEVGVIPEEWEVVELGDLKPFVTSGSRGWASLYSEHGSLFVRITNLSRESIYLDLTDSKFVQLPPEAHEGVRTKLNEQDVLISITADIGIVGYVDARVPSPAYINQHIALVRLDPCRASGKFVSYFLASEQPQRLFRSATDVGAKAGMSLIMVKMMKTALPPLPEQRAIATALSDVDALLSGLERLIAKKRDLKQAAMQQLLTGQTRLPGFHGEWEVKRLGEVGSTYSGLTGKTKADFGVGTGRYVTFTNVITNVVIDCGLIEHVRLFPGESQNRVIEGDLLFNGSSETPEEVAMCSFMASEVSNLFLNSFCFGFRLRDAQQADGLFLAYYLRANPGRELMKSLAQGSTRYNLSKTALLEASIRLPSRDEQTAIAAVLSDMDAELAALEARHAKTRDLKQAMMQELLTGRTRLV